jgi:hypothetical protein
LLQAGLGPSHRTLEGGDRQSRRQSWRCEWGWPSRTAAGQSALQARTTHGGLLALQYTGDADGLGGALSGQDLGGLHRGLEHRTSRRSGGEAGGSTGRGPGGGEGGVERLASPAWAPAEAAARGGLFGLDLLELRQQEAEAGRGEGAPRRAGTTQAGAGQSRQRTEAPIAPQPGRDIVAQERQPLGPWIVQGLAEATAEQHASHEVGGEAALEEVAE